MIIVKKDEKSLIVRDEYILAAILDTMPPNVSGGVIEKACKLAESNGHIEVSVSSIVQPGRNGQ